MTLLSRTAALLVLVAGCRSSGDERRVAPDAQSDPLPVATASVPAIASGVTIPPVPSSGPVIATVARAGPLRPASTREDGSPARPQSMCFTRSGLLVVAIHDGVVGSTAPRPPRSVEVWDVAKARKVRELAYDDVSVVACRGDRIAIVRGASSEILVLSAASFEVESKVECHADAFAFAPTADRIAVKCFRGPLELHEVSGDRKLLTAPDGIEKPWSMEFSHDGRFVAIGTSGTKSAYAFVWDLTTNRLASRLGPHDAIFGEPTASTLPGDRADRPRAVRSAVFTPDDKQLATGSFDGIVRLWDREGDGGAKTLAKHAGAIGQVAFSPDGRLLASADDAEVQVWSLAKNERVASIPKQVAKGAIGKLEPSLAWTNDALFLAIGWPNGAIALWPSPPR